ncbi:hypothetical protein LTR95_015978 [Oleoguttula sp. CCFEE 5521]
MHNRVKVIERLIGLRMGAIALSSSRAQLRRAGNQADRNVLQGDPDLLGAVKGIIYLGCPHRGVRSSWITKALAQSWTLLGANAAVFDELQHSNANLQDLHDAYLSATRGRNIRMTNFYEERKTPYVPLYPIHLVPRVDAIFDDYSKEIHSLPMPTDHSGLNKFASKCTPGYVSLRDELLTMLSATQDAGKDAAHAGKFIGPWPPPIKYALRQALDAELCSILATPALSSDLAHAVAILGAGGFGKTQMAANYALKHSSKYNIVLWIDAHDEETVRSNFRLCCIALQIKVHCPDGPPVGLRHASEIKELHAWLRKRVAPDHAWLMIVDNANNLAWAPESSLREIVPQRLGTPHRGSVIVTSWNKISADLVDGSYRLTVGAMSEDEGVTLLLQGIGVDDEGNRASLHDLAGATVTRLGGLPLAIAIAAARIKSQGRDGDFASAIEQYNDDLDLNKDILLKIDAFRGLRNNQQTVWTVWNTAFMAIADESRDYGSSPLTMLTFLALFSRTGVGGDFFEYASLGLAEMHGWFPQPGGLPNWLINLVRVRSGK